MSITRKETTEITCDGCGKVIVLNVLSHGIPSEWCSLNIEHYGEWATGEYHMSKHLCEKCTYRVGDAIKKALKELKV